MLAMTTQMALLGLRVSTDVNTCQHSNIYGRMS